MCIKIRIFSAEPVITEAANFDLPTMEVVGYMEKNELNFRVYDNETSKGFIVLAPLSRYPKVWFVKLVRAERGFGPVLYDVAMEYVQTIIKGLGICPDPVETTQEAQSVWKHYSTMDNIIMHPLPKNCVFPELQRPQFLGYYFSKKNPDYLKKLINSDRFIFEDD